MSWAIAYDEKWKRDIGYGVPAICDHPGCGAEINRGLSYVCGGEAYGGDRGCGLFFCEKHLVHHQFRGEELLIQVCERCDKHRKPFEPTADKFGWIHHKMTDPSWAEWREEQRKDSGDSELGEVSATLQDRVRSWMLACFGERIAADTRERNHRFLEEALELVQSCGCSHSEARQLVDYVFNRPVGEMGQEMGGVMVTLAALANAQGLHIDTCAQTEVARVWTKIEQIRAKQASKPSHSPLPERVC